MNYCNNCHAENKDYDSTARDELIMIWILIDAWKYLFDDITFPLISFRIRICLKLMNKMSD